MFDHVDFAVTDLARSRDFYTTVLATLGISPLVHIQRTDGREGTGFGIAGDARFWIGGGRPVEGRLHIAFQAESRDAVVAFHAAALGAGAVDRGGPALRPQYGDSYYAAFVLDPDGHVIEAVCRRADG
ncbi:VOC family protein [Lysobacter koreensis]|uniref:VOC family protein n=1 Tax=Lysobacter koreensis TaxID=266122 RepID=A0ABW2YUB7_9GAMM